MNDAGVHEARTRLATLLDRLTISSRPSSSELHEIIDLEIAATSDNWRFVFDLRSETIEQRIRDRMEIFIRCIAPVQRIINRLHLDTLTVDEIWLVYLPLAMWIDTRRRLKRPDQAYIVGFYGGAGIGKSTTTAILRTLISSGLTRRVATLSMDDLYKTRADREPLKRLGYDGHRGPPGTHDIAVGVSALQRLRTADHTAITTLPRYDKRTDDRATEPQVFEGFFEFVFLEGYLVGVYTAVDPTVIDDPYKRRVAEALRTYAPLFDELDSLIVRPLHELATVRRMYGEQVRRDRESAEALGRGWKGHLGSDIREHIERIYVTPWVKGLTAPEPRFEDTTIILRTTPDRRIVDVEPGGAY